MIRVSQWAEIRQMHLVDGVPKKEIARRLDTILFAEGGPAARAYCALGSGQPHSSVLRLDPTS